MRVVAFISLLVALVAHARVPELDNGLIAARFEVSSSKGGAAAVRTTLFVYEAGKRLELPVCAQGGLYRVVDLAAAQFHSEGFYPYWVRSKERDLEVNRVYSPFALPGSLELVPISAHQAGNSVVLDFERTDAGKLSAIWSLPQGAKTFDVTLRFEPTRKGKFLLGCQLFDARDLDDINRLLLPIMWQQKRFPDKPYLLFDPQTSTPVSLMEYNQGGSPLSVALLAPPDEFKFAWPNQRQMKFGLSIRNQAGKVQPLICGPFDQDGGSEPVVLTFQVLAAKRDWYSAFRTIVDDVYQLRDYRRNVGVNLTDSIFNMIDLMMDDDKGGFWPKAKGFYQIESLNGSTQAAPLMMLSLYYLTADMQLYKRRTLPSIEYTLSRESVHFTPVPENTGHYAPGGMKGPVANYGTTVYGGFWEMSNHLMPVFKAVAFHDHGINFPQGSTHAQSFEEWLERYRITGDKGDLEQAERLADRYIVEHIDTLPEADLGLKPFFLISFLPDWEGLLRLYEETGQQRYLEASVYGARLLTTGIWTFPRIPEGEVTIHPGNRFEGDIPNICMRKGPAEFRLGYDQNPANPRQGVQKNPPRERKVPAWQVSNVGLGFEQPSTLFHPLDKERKARLIYQAVWAPAMLRLAKYTGDRTFETYARNAVLGRWANYPGYYATGQTDLPNDPNYPLIGPDISCIYYHHIPVHLGWSIDYLLSDAFLLSNGRVEFPAEVQNGYAYFDMKCYGHKPGRAFGEDGLWLWLKRGLVNVDNPQVNYIPMDRNGTLFVIFTNQSRTEEHFIASFGGQSVKAARLYNGEGIASAAIGGDRLQFSMPARSVFMVQLPASSLPSPAIHHEVSGVTHTDSFRTVRAADGITAKGTAIQVRPEFWSGYIWLEAKYKDIASAAFYISKDGGPWQKVEDREYPFEYSTGMMTPADRLQWYVSGMSGDGQPFKTELQGMTCNRAVSE